MQGRQGFGGYNRRQVPEPEQRGREDHGAPMKGARQAVPHHVNRSGKDDLGNGGRESGARDDRREKQESVHVIVIGGPRLIQQRLRGCFPACLRQLGRSTSTASRSVAWRPVHQGNA